MNKFKSSNPAQGAWTLPSLLNENFYRLLIVSVMVFFSFTVNATIYYVSTSGSDSNLGTSESLPWKTLTKVNSFTPKAGDQILFKRGDIWSGTIKVKASGKTGYQTVYGAYGIGSKPKIYGSEEISGWKLHAGNIYKATFNTQINQLFIDGVRAKAARYPNTGYVSVNTVNSTKSFTCDALSGTINYTGAKWIARTSPYSMETMSISSSASKTLTLSSSPYPNLNTKTGFILVGKLEFLDSAGEWYYDTATKTVYLWTPEGDSPINHAVRGSVYDNGVTGSSYEFITIKDLEFLHSKVCGISSAGSYLNIDNNTVSMPDAIGIFVTPGVSNAITNNTINGANHIGIEGYSDKSTYSDNKINNTALLEELGLSGIGEWYMGSGMYVEGDDNVIKYNRVTNSGYNGIQFHKRNVVEYNFVQNALLTKDDGGGIYTAAAGSYPNAPTSGSIIRFNIVDGVFGSLNGCNPYGVCQGHGIYLDENSGGVTVEYNTVTNNSDAGIFLHNSFNETVRYNTSFNNGRQYHVSTDLGGSKFHDNVFYAMARNMENYSNQYLGSQRDGKVTFTNNSYINHHNKSGVFKVDEIKNYDFAGWKSVTGQDANSTIDIAAMVSGETEELFYNDSKQTKTISLESSIYKDIQGKQITGSFTLLPFTSVILIKTKPENISDTTPPTIISFIVPSNSSTLLVPVSSFSASDNKAVTGFLLTESSAIPKANDTGWDEIAPASYTFNSEGTKTLYAWTKDAAGNVSNSATKQLVISLLVTKPETVTNKSEIVANRLGIAGSMEVSDLATTSPNLRATPVTFNEAGMIESISIYHNGGTGKAQMAVYSDQSGLPSTQLGKTASTVINSTCGWQTGLLTSPVLVNAGQTYWLSWVFENNPGIRYSIGSPGRAQSSKTWVEGMPIAFGASTMANYNYSVYCTYTPLSTAILIGTSEVYPSVSTAPNRRAVAVTFQDAGIIESISLYHNGGNGNVLMGVYSDQAGLPSAQLGKTTSTEINSTAGWQTVSLSNQVWVNAGQTIWLSWVFENNPGIRYAIGAPGRAQSSKTWTDGMPTSFGTSGMANYNYSIYCTFRSSVVTNNGVDLLKSGIVQEEVAKDENADEKEQVITQLSNTVDLFDNLKIEIYPNPATNNVTIRFSEFPEDGTRITIFDITGREMQSRIVQNIQETLDIQELKQGMYLVKTEFSNNFKTQKLIKR